MGKANGEQNTSTPAAGTLGTGGESGGAVPGGAAPAATVMIKDGAKTSAKVTTVQFNTPATPNLDAASLGAISPEIAKIVKHVTQGSTTIGACMMWLARQTDADLRTDRAQRLLEYCQWRRDLQDRLASPYGACLAWLASGENPGDEVRGKLCGEALRSGAPTPVPDRVAPTQVAAR